MVVISGNEFDTTFDTITEGEREKSNQLNGEPRP